MIKKVVSHTAIYGLAPQITKVAGFFTLPIITRYLTREDYGIAGIVTAYSGAFEALQLLGMNIILVNSFFKSPSQYKWMWRQVHGFLTLWSIMYALLLASILYVALPTEVGENRWIIIVLVCIPPALFNTTNILATYSFQLSDQPLPLVSRTVLIGLITVGLNLYTIAYLRLGYMGWFWSNLVSGIVGFLAFAYPLYFKQRLTPIFNFKRRTIRQALTVSIPMVPHYYSAYLLNSSDRLVMDLLKVNVSSIGIYSLAATFGNYFNALSNAFTKAVAPIYNRLYREEAEAGQYQIRTLTFTALAAWLSITFIVCLWLREAFELLISNDELQSAYPIAIILIMGYNYRPMYAAASVQLMYHEKTQALWKITFVAGVGNVVLNVLLIPIFGVKVAAVTTFLSLMYFGYAGFYLKAYRAYNPLNYYPVGWLFLTIAITIIVYLLRDIMWLQKAIITGFLVIATSIPIMKTYLLKQTNGG